MTAIAKIVKLEGLNHILDFFLTSGPINRTELFR